MVFFLGLLVLAVVVGGVALATAGVFFWREQHARHRAAFYASVASRLGFDVVEGAAGTPNGEPFATFAAHGPQALRGRRHLVRGAGAAVLRLGDVSQPGDTSGDLTLAALEDPGLDLPLFTARPRGAFGAPWQPAVAFPDDPVFERVFEVFGLDPAAVRTVLGPTVRAALVAHGEGLYWEAHGRHLAVTDGGLADLGEAEGLLDGLDAIVRVLPRGAGQHPP